MRNYTEAELLTMVDFVVEAKRTGNPLYQQFLMVLSMVSNQDPRALDARIHKIKETGKFY